MYVYTVLVKQRTCTFACSQQVMDVGGLQGQQEFNNEVTLLSHITHSAIVRLLGVCHDKQLQCLVYELMPYGNLEDRLTCKVPTALDTVLPCRSALNMYNLLGMPRA